MKGVRFKVRVKTVTAYFDGKSATTVLPEIKFLNIPREADIALAKRQLMARVEFERSGRGIRRPEEMMQ